MGGTVKPAASDHELVDARLQLPRWLWRRLKVLSAERENTPSRLVALMVAPFLEDGVLPGRGLWVPEPPDLDSEAAA